MSNIGAVITAHSKCVLSENLVVLNGNPNPTA